MRYDFEEWKFKELSTWMDGGSVTVNYTDKNGLNNTIEIVQNVTAEYYEEMSKIPGRVYVNNDLIDKRSNQEDTVVQQLSKDLENHNIDLDKEVIKEKINWINSTQYLEFEPTKLIMSEKRKKQLRNSEIQN
jgi:hypothetical protein